MKPIRIKEDVLRDLSRFADPVITFQGARVHIELRQELFDAEGQPVGVATVLFEGRRDFGRVVEFANPVEATVLGAPKSEEEYFKQAAQFAVEAMADLSEGK